MIDIEETVEPDPQAWRNILDRDELKLNIRIFSDALDPAIESCIKSAVSICDYVHGDLRISALPRTFKFYRPSWPDKCTDDGFFLIRLPFPPCVSVASVKYLDEAGVEQTLPATNYIVRKPKGCPAEVVFISDSLPSTKNHARAITVEYRAGYGDNTTGAPKVPHNLRQLVSMYAAHFLENPEATVNEGRLITMNRSVDFGVKFLADQIRVPHEYRDWE